MAVLNAWQRIDRVLPGKPWGNGSGGSATVSSDPNTRATASGSAGSTSLTIGSAILSNGDVFAIHQTYDTGVGQWEINRVASGGGSTSITCQTALHYTYGTGAQVIKFPLNTTATVNAHSATAYNGSAGGIEFIVAKDNITVSGAFNGSGSQGAFGTSDGGTTSGGGFRGGGRKFGNPATANSGDGTTGLTNAQNTARGNGGGGGTNNVGYAGGGGGGHTASGTAGTAYSGGGTAGAAGGTGGAADLTTMVFGGGGGGASRDGTSRSAGSGGSGGGILVLISKSITLSAGVTANGGKGGSPTDGDHAAGGGGGAGGSILIVCDTASLGTNQATATAGAGGTVNGTPGSTCAPGGAGAVGRISVHHKGTVTGTTNPTFNDTSEPTLIEIPDAGGAFLYNFI